MTRQAISPRLATRTEENRRLMPILSPRTAGAFPRRRRDPRAPRARAALPQSSSPPPRHRLPGPDAASGEEALGLGVGAWRAAFDRLEERLELFVSLRLPLAEEVGEADRRRLAPVEAGAGQRKSPRNALAQARDEVGRDLRRRQAEARLGRARTGRAAVAMTMSGAAARPMPPPTAAPSTTAMVTNGSAANRAKKRPPAAFSACKGIGLSQRPAAPRAPPTATSDRPPR